MPFLYNVHTANKTFALAYKENEGFDDLVTRIARKAGISQSDIAAVKEGKDGAGVVYEYDSGRWTLEDDDDLSILLSRYPPSTTQSVTLHLNAPHAHARFAANPPSYTAASALKNRTQRSNGPLSPKSASKTPSKPKANGTASSDPASAPSAPAPAISAPSHHFPASTHSGNPKPLPILSKPVPGEKVQVVGHTEGKEGDHHDHSKASLAPPRPFEAKPMGKKAPSVFSTISRKSKYGDNERTPLWETKKRAWLEFHNGSGVRTVIGKVGDVDNVRMLLKPGYKGVYVSRPFATKAKLGKNTFSMGQAGYTGLSTLGKIPITVAGRTAEHQAMISEEAHFDVVLGRQWVERMNVKIDPNDQTALTYMDSGETIPVDIVVLKDDKGNKIHIT